MLRKLFFSFFIIIFPVLAVADDIEEMATPAQMQEQARILTQRPVVQKLILSPQQNLKEIYEWFNEIGIPQNPMTIEDVEEFFTPTAFIQVDGKVIASGYKDIFIYLQSLRANYKSMQILLPLQDSVITNDKIAVRYVINAVAHDGQKFKISVIAILKLVENRIAEFSEVTYKEAVKFNFSREVSFKK